MGLFSRKAKRIAKNAAKQVILPDDPKRDKKNKGKDAEPAAPAHTDEEYDALKEKYEAVMTEKWKEYYKTSCDGECETCEYYDWCPDDFDGVFPEDEVEEPEEVEEAEADEEHDEDELEDEDDEDDEPEVELTPEEQEAKAAAEAYYEDGCDGECEMCEHYDWCPAEEENEDDKVIYKGITQGDVKNAAKEGVNLARETALAARDLKDALDDITGGLNMKELLK